MNKYFVYACDKNGSKVCVYMDDRGIERSSSIPQTVSSEDLSKVIDFVLEYYQSDHAEVYPA